MGLSKLFPCQRRLRERQKAKAQQKDTERQQQNGTASNTPPKIPPISDLSNNAGETAEAPKQETLSKGPEVPDLSTSQQVWNRAYHELATAEDTKELVEAYVKAIPEATKSNDEDKNAVSGAEQTPVEMKDPVRRQEIMKAAVIAGQEKIDKSTKVTNAVGGFSSFVLKFKGVIDFAVGTNPQAALPWAGVCIGLTFLLNPYQASQSNLKGIAHVTSRMKWYCSLTEHLLSKDYLDVGGKSFESVLEQLEERVVALYKAILLYQMKSVCSYYDNQGWVFLRNIINVDDWDGELAAVESAEAAVKNDSEAYNNQEGKKFLGELVLKGQQQLQSLGDLNQTLQQYIATQSNIKRKTDEDNCLKDLFILDPKGQMDTIQGKNDKLLDEAYKWILDTKEYRDFTNWGDQASCKVLWLNGPAGTGKTMLVIGIIFELFAQSSILAPGVSYFFCQTQGETMTNPTEALRALMWLLLIQQPHLLKYVIEKHKTSGAAFFRGSEAYYTLVEVFKEMLADPGLSPVYLILDALDECEDGQPGIHDLMLLISDSMKITDKAKWLVSSRPEVDVLTKLGDRRLTELDVQVRKEPVNAYISYKLSQMERYHGYNKIALDKMSVEIHERAQNTFLWVALVFRDLIKNKVRPYYAVEYIKKSPPSLSSLYGHMMEKIEKGERDPPELCKAVLAASTLAFQPLSFAELHILSGLPSEIPSSDILQSCGSFLAVKDGLVHVLHNSARQYLEAYFKSHEGGLTKIHIDMANRSMEAMSKVLKFNVYNLQPGSEASEITKPKNNDSLLSIRYSCGFWVNHLCGPEGPRDGQLLDYGEVFAFLEKHFLHWLEGLSLIQKLPTALSSIRKLTRNLETTRNTSPKLSSFLKDAERFVSGNLSIIEKAPLQTYGAALAFSPNKSEMKSRYWNERLPFIGNITGIRDGWDPCLHTQGPVGFLKRVLFSPDGKFYAASSDFEGGKVQLWDADTGFCTQTLTLKDHTAHSMAFSPDSKLLASVSCAVVQIWNLSTGACAQSFALHTEEANRNGRWRDASKSIAFSNDGNTLAIAFNESVEIWDIATEQCKKALRGHSKDVTSVVYSPDGKTIASASEDGTVKLWDYPVGTCQRTLKEGKYPRLVLFSPDGRNLACVNGGEDNGFDNETLTVWDLPSGTYTHTIGPDPAVHAAAFTSDSKAFAITSPASGKIHLLDVSTGARIQSFNEGGFPIDVSVSPTKSLVVSASIQGLVRVWDTTGISEESPVGHNKAIGVVKLSPDGRSLATGSLDKTVKLWNIADETCTRTLEGHADRVEQIAFSPDSKTIASGAFDGSVRTWDLATGSSRRILEPSDEGGSPAVAFSEDGLVLATADCDIVKLWDPITGTCKQTVDANTLLHSDVTAMAFSRDRKMILMTSIFEGGHIIDISTGTRTHTLQSDGSPYVCFPAISSNGRLCAMGSSNNEVELWDTATGTLQQTIHSSVCGNELSFSDDSNYLQTSQGSYKLTSGVLATSLDPELSGGVLFSDMKWIVRGDQKLLWIPPDYRGCSATLGQNAVALTSARGQVIFLRVN